MERKKKKPLQGRRQFFPFQERLNGWALTSAQKMRKSGGKKISLFFFNASNKRDYPLYLLLPLPPPVCTCFLRRGGGGAGPGRGCHTSAFARRRNTMKVFPPPPLFFLFLSSVPRTQVNLTLPSFFLSSFSLRRR